MNRWRPGRTTWALALVLAVVIAVPVTAHVAEAKEGKAKRADAARASWRVGLTDAA